MLCKINYVFPHSEEIERGKMNEKKRNRNKKLQIFLSDTEYEMAKDKANYSGLSMSGFIRNLIVNGAIIKYEMKAANDVLVELNKIGTNINQIARKVNQKDFTTYNDLEELRAQYEKMFELITSKMMGV